MRPARAVSEDHDQTLALARGGDPAAFAAVVRRHQAMVFSLALHALRSRAAAEDLAQEVFLELYRSLARIESDAHVVSWLRRVTSHRCIDELRRLRYRMELAVDAVPDRGAAPASREPFLEERLQELVAGLPPRARGVNRPGPYRPQTDDPEHQEHYRDRGRGRHRPPMMRPNRLRQDDPRPHHRRPPSRQAAPDLEQLPPAVAPARRRAALRRRAEAARASKLMPVP